MKKLVLSVLLAGLVVAGDIGVRLTEIQIPMYSRHYDGDFHRVEGLNEKNQGLLVDFEVDKIREIEFKVGTFRNSLNRQSFFFGVEKGLDLAGGVRAGVTGGFATGYDTPVLAGGFVEYAGLGLFGARVDYTYEPENEINIVGFSIVYRFQ